MLRHLGPELWTCLEKNVPHEEYTDTTSLKADREVVVRGEIRKASQSLTGFYKNSQGLPRFVNGLHLSNGVAIVFMHLSHMAFLKLC